MRHLNIMMIIGYIILLICKYLSFVMFEHAENGLTIPINYSPINQIFHKLGHLLMSLSNSSATIFVEGCQIQELRLNFWNDFFSKITQLFWQMILSKKIILCLDSL
jgi:hypothetical protein